MCLTLSLSAGDSTWCLTATSLVVNRSLPRARTHTHACVPLEIFLVDRIQPLWKLMFRDSHPVDMSGRDPFPYSNHKPCIHAARSVYALCANSESHEKCWDFYGEKYINVYVWSIHTIVCLGLKCFQYIKSMYSHWDAAKCRLEMHNVTVNGPLLFPTHISLYICKYFQAITPQELWLTPHNPFTSQH